jgi:hypothetical protein
MAKIDYSSPFAPVRERGPATAAELLGDRHDLVITLCPTDPEGNPLRMRPGTLNFDGNTGVYIGR